MMPRRRPRIIYIPRRRPFIMNREVDWLNGIFDVRELRPEPEQAIELRNAVRNGDLPEVKKLLGIDTDSQGFTPLLPADEGRQLAIRNDCKINSKGYDGLTPVMSAARSGRKDIIEVLLKGGAEVNCTDELQETLLHHASGKGWVDLVQYILEQEDVDVNAGTYSGETPLMYAAREGHEDVAAVLIGGGADVNRSNLAKWTALHKASFKGHVKVVQILLEKGGSHLNLQDDSGNTPLHRACAGGYQEIIKMLLIAGADTNMKNSENKTAFSVGIGKDKLTVAEIKLFLEHGVVLDDCDYKQMCKNPSLNLLTEKKAYLWSQSIVNKFNHKDLPSMYRNPDLAEVKLPCFKSMRLQHQQVDDIQNYVESEIQADPDTFNLAKARPIVLALLCVEKLLVPQPTAKRSASQTSSDCNATAKNPRLD